MTQTTTKELKQLQGCIDYQFKQPVLLKRALTHCSALSSSLTGHLERQEFLGDAVLGLVIAEALYKRFPDEQEGKLSKMRANLVCRDTLLEIAAQWQLTGCLVVGDGERMGKGKQGIKSPSIAANAVEAVIGAVFEDGGWQPARQLVLSAWHPLLQGIGVLDNRDAKSRLQELTQGKGWGLPVYTLTDHGAGKQPRFDAECSVQGRVLGRGRGDRKKLAEIDSAEQAWSKLNDD